MYAEARAGYTLAPCGDVAQLGERRVRNAEVVSSILIVSTTYTKADDSASALSFAEGCELARDDARPSGF